MSGFFNRAGRAVMLLVHLAALGVGLVVAFLVVQSFVQNAAGDSPEIALSRIATAATLVAIVLAFVMILQWRGFSPDAPFYFALSYAAVGAVVSGNARAMAKQFAPAAPNEVTFMYVTSSAQIAVVCLLALGAWAWTYQRSRFPLI